jgi:ABC-type multidrug transport system permease subunit
MIPYSNRFTALTIAMTIVFGYMTLYSVLPLPLGFAATLGSVMLLIASMVSVLPNETELTIQQEIDAADHLDEL